ncbi:MAG: rhomboid family intramembrane serine protease [Aquabacterium sp.]|nr:MAG: rhomboid family intramembrane serine protease [Aquabacterium sp.]
MQPLPPITQALMLINVMVYCIQLIAGPWFTNLFSLNSVGWGFMPWQLVTYAFLHQSFGHLFFNMVGLYMFGSELELTWSRKRYLQFYAVSLLVAGLSILLLALVLGGPVRASGASGALFGLLVGYAMLNPNRIIMPIIPPIPMKARTFAIVFGVLALVQSVPALTGGLIPGATNVGHIGHVGGMLGGWLMMRYWGGKPPFRPRRRLH